LSRLRACYFVAYMFFSNKVDDNMDT
jgi:hypothetical protein